MRLIAAFFSLALLASCAGQTPQQHKVEDLEIFTAPFPQVWQIVEDMARSGKWRIEESERDGGRAYLMTDWMADEDNGGDYGRTGISLGKANKPHNDKTREVAISIRVVSESPTATRVKVTCMFRIQTAVGTSTSGQTMFGTSKGVVERKLLNTIRSRLAVPSSAE